MKKILHWLDENLEEFILVLFLIAMTLIMGVQVFCRYVLGMSLSWSEELTRYLFIWCGFLSVSYCSKKCLSIKIEQFVAIFPRRGKALFKVVNHTFELIFFIYMIPFAWSYMMSSVHSGQLSPAFMYRQHLLSPLFWLPSVSCSAGSSSSVLHAAKMYLIRLIRNAILLSPSSRQTPNHAAKMRWNPVSTTVSIPSKIRMRRNANASRSFIYYLCSLTGHRSSGIHHSWDYICSSVRV